MNCSILTPAFTISNYDHTSLLSQCAENLGVETSDLELFTLVPLNQASQSSPSSIVIKLKQSPFSVTKIEELLMQRDQLFQQLQKSRDALSSYSEKLQEKKDPVTDEKSTRKIVKLEEDNKKLRQLLKTQLDNAENLRLATQRTVENLREEFDLLVRELLNVKKTKEKIEETPKTEKKANVPKLKIGAN